MMEKWKDEMMGSKQVFYLKSSQHSNIPVFPLLGVFPLFQYSIIPFFPINSF
jgi:hypothetical protein